jgi:hypothetical protein
MNIADIEKKCVVFFTKNEITFSLKKSPEHYIKKFIHIDCETISSLGGISIWDNFTCEVSVYFFHQEECIPEHYTFQDELELFNILEKFIINMKSAGK